MSNTFNRTFEELKLMSNPPHWPMIRSFNRTFEELKYGFKVSS